MPRVSKAQARANHQAIETAASRLFRQRGLSGVSDQGRYESGRGENPRSETRQEARPEGEGRPSVRHCTQANLAG